MPPRGGDPRSYWSDTPLSWEDLQRILASGELDDLVRSREVCARYNDFTDELEEKYDSVGDYVLVRVFGWEAQPLGSGGKLRAVPPAGFSRAVRFVANDFPYYMTAGLEHHIVWVASASGQVSPLSAEELQAEVARHRPPKAWEAQIAVNPPRLQSVTTVWHAHVFSRPRAGAGEGGGGARKGE